MTLDLKPYTPQSSQSAFPTSQPAPSKTNFVNKLGGLLDKFGQHSSNIALGIASGVAEPFTKVVGSGVRSIQAIPKTITGHGAEADAILNKPIFGQPTLHGSTPLQNVGTAAEVASYAIGGEGASSVEKGAVKAAAKTGSLTGSLNALGQYVANEKDPTIGKALASTAVGGVVGGAVGAGLGYLSGRLQNTPSRQLDDTWKTVQPNMTPKEQALAVKAGKLEVQKGTVTLKPSGQDLQMRDLAHSLGVTSKNDPITNVNLMKQGISDSAVQVRADLQGTGAKWNDSELTSKLKTNILDKIEQGKPGFISVKSDATLNNTAKNLVRSVNDLAVNANRQATGLLDMRQQFDDIVEQEFGTNVFAKTDPRGNIVRAIRQSLNQLLEDKAPTAAIKDELQNQHLLYRAIDNIASKTPKGEEVGGLGYKVGSTTLQRALKHPITKVAEGVAGGVGAYEVGKKLIGK